MPKSKNDIVSCDSLVCIYICHDNYCFFTKLIVHEETWKYTNKMELGDLGCMNNADFEK